MASTVIFDTLMSSLRSAAIEAAIEVDPNNLRVRDTFLERLMREKQEIARSRHIAHLPPAPSTDWQDWVSLGTDAHVVDADPEALDPATPRPGPVRRPAEAQPEPARSRRRIA